MNVIKGKPPNWEEIIKRFPGVNPATVVVTYGDDVYMVGGGDMYPDLQAHEGTHVLQQKAIGVQAWWDRYLTDDNFLMAQEIEAYRVQYLFKKREQKNREQVAKFLVFIAKQLSGPMYGNAVSFPDALKLIRNGA